MLGKLLKHEWKSVYKFGSLLVLTILVLTAIGYLFLSSSVVGDLIAGEVVLSEVEALTLGISSVGTVLLCYLALIGAVYGAMIYMGVRFYKTMYTNQGYLTHTLPVKSGQLLASKILVAGGWMLMVYAVLLFSVVILLVGLFKGAFGDVLIGISFEELRQEVSALYSEMGFDMPFFGVVFLVYMLISPFAAVIRIFGALTIGQLSKKHKLMVGVFTYIGVIVFDYVSIVFAESIIMINSMFTNTGEVPVGFMNSTYIVSMVYMIVSAVVLVIVSHLIIKKKLNME